MQHYLSNVVNSSTNDRNAQYYRFHAIEQKFTKELQQIRNDVAALKHKIAFREATASPDSVKEDQEDKGTVDGRYVQGTCVTYMKQ